MEPPRLRRGVSGFVLWSGAVGGPDYEVILNATVCAAPLLPFALGTAVSR